MARRTKPTATTKLTTDQKAEAERIRQALLEASDQDIRELAELLASREDSNILGATEFAVRDIVHRIGAKAVQTALEGRKKGGTTEAVASAPTANTTPNSNDTEAKPS
jgi:hypothetical protein